MLRQRIFLGLMACLLTLEPVASFGGSREPALRLCVDPVHGVDDGQQRGTDSDPLRTVSYALRRADHSLASRVQLSLAPGEYSTVGDGTGEPFPLDIPPRLDDASELASSIVLGRHQLFSLPLVALLVKKRLRRVNGDDVLSRRRPGSIKGVLQFVTALAISFPGGRGGVFRRRPKLHRRILQGVPAQRDFALHSG